MTSEDRDTEKMAALGRMTRGLVHDFNNSLASIMGYAEFLSNDLPLGSDQNLFAENIRKAGLQLQDMVDQIRAVGSEHGQGKDMRIDIVQEIYHLCDVIQAGLDTPHKIYFETDVDAACITSIPFQFRTAIRNILRNAVTALPANRGTINVRITTETNNDLKDYAATSILCSSPDIQPTDKILSIFITDTGCGMDSTLLKNACTPHVSTHNKDDAHGIGLNIAADIIRYLGGGLVLYSTPDEGSCAAITLPAHIQSTLPLPAPTTSRNIILIEDGRMLSHTLTHYLERQDHHVMLSNNVFEGLDMLRDHVGHTSIAIINLSTIIESPETLIADIRGDFPDLPIIVTSADHDALIKFHNNTKDSRISICPLPFSHSAFTRIMQTAFS